MATGATGAARAGLQRPVQLRIPGGRRERCLVASPPGSSAHSRQHRNTPTGRHPLDATGKNPRTRNQDQYHPEGQRVISSTLGRGALGNVRSP